MFVSASIIGNFLVVLFFAMTDTAPALKVVFIILNIALQNAMACRVFRYLRLGYITSIEPVLVDSDNISLPCFNHENVETNDERLQLGDISRSPHETLGTGISFPSQDKL